jgi:hypothetical protein
MIKLFFTLLYLDPGTGSLLIQFLVAAVFGVIIFFKQLKIRIKHLVNRILKRKQEED